MAIQYLNLVRWQMAGTLLYFNSQYPSAVFVHTLLYKYCPLVVRLTAEEHLYIVPRVPLVCLSVCLSTYEGAMPTA